MSQNDFGLTMSSFSVFLENPAMRENPALRTGRGFCVLDLVIFGQACFQASMLRMKRFGSTVGWLTRSHLRFGYSKPHRFVSQLGGRG